MVLLFLVPKYYNGCIVDAQLPSVKRRNGRTGSPTRSKRLQCIQQMARRRILTRGAGTGTPGHRSALLPTIFPPADGCPAARAGVRSTASRGRVGVGAVPDNR